MTSDYKTRNRNIAKNTLVLYVRMVLMLFVQFYTVPIVLQRLGVQDYGIFNVVGGVVTMFSFVGASLSSGTQRFMAYALGKNDIDQAKVVFSNTLILYLIFGVILFILLELGGVWFLNNKMSIPDSRMYAANWVFQLSLLSFLINLISIPYNSIIIAHEKMFFYAYISMFECLSKLFVVLSLIYFSLDSLILYALLLCMVSFFVAVIYILYSYVKFAECKCITLLYDKSLGNNLVSYSGWNIIGAIALILRNQGVNVLLNIFFSPIVNAAHSLSQQIFNAINQFINNIYLASRPQITKRYAEGDINGMWNLVYTSTKIAFVLLLFIVTPLLEELPTVLQYWIKNIPEYTVNITRLILFSLLIETLTNQIIGVFQAYNLIKYYQLYSSTLLLLNIPVSYFLLRFQICHPYVPYIVMIILSFFYVCSLLFMAKKYLALSVSNYIFNVLFPLVLLSLLSIILVFMISNYLVDGIQKLIIIVIVSTSLIAFLSYFIVMNKEEKNLLLKNFKFSNRL